MESPIHVHDFSGRGRKPVRHHPRRRRADPRDTFLRALSDQLAGVGVDPALAEKLDELVAGFTGLV